MEKKTVEKVVYQDRVVEKRVEVKVRDEATAQVVERWRVVHVDGKVEEGERARTDTRATERAEASAETVTERVVYLEKLVHQVVERHRPDWRVGVLAAVRPGELRPSLGVLVERQVLGPFSLGAFALAAPADPLGSAQLGAAITVEF